MVLLLHTEKHFGYELLYLSKWSFLCLSINGTQSLYGLAHGFEFSMLQKPTIRIGITCKKILWWMSIEFGMALK